MSVMTSLGWFVLFTGLFWTGEVIQTALAIPLPGALIGMALLLGALSLRGGGASPGLETAASGLLAHLALFFVPAGAGVMLHFHLLANDGRALAVALVLSTIIAVAATGLIARAFLRSGDRN